MFKEARRLDINFEGDLNPDQLAAVTSPPNRPALVLAGAGSGKTRTLTYRVAWLISECGLDPSDILLLTFTNKAANQMLARIEDLTGCESWRFWGGTFHSVGNKFLRIEGEKIGLDPNFSIIDSEDSDKLIKETVDEKFPRFFSDKENPRPKLLREIISYARNTCASYSAAMCDRFDWIETPSNQIFEIAEFYSAKKREKNLCDFDDLLELWHKLLLENADVLEKYRARFKNILVDEYQDTNLLQSKIIDLLADRGQLSAVGDDAQCIYSWRGAEIENIRNFRQRYPAALIYKIERNYRSTPQILNFANALLKNMPVHEDYRKELSSARGNSMKPMVIRAMDAISQGRQVADFIREIEDGGKYGYDDIAVLYRSHFQAMDLQLQLQYKNIPFVMTSGVKFFEQSHIKDVVAQIKFIANPRDSVSFARFANFLPKVGGKTAMKIYSSALEISKKRNISPIAALADKKVAAKVPSAAREIFEKMARDLLVLEEMLASLEAESGERLKGGEDSHAQTKSVQSDFLSAMLDETPAQPCPENIRIVRDCQIKDIVKAACTGWYKDAMKTAYEDWRDRADDFDALVEYAARYKNFDELLANATLEISEAEGRPAENSSRVRLMTVHQAKGLEFPVVFVIGAADGLFPTKRSIEDGSTDEEERLFYVAATRAKDCLIIAYPRVSTSGGDYEMREQSRFLNGVDPSLFEVL